MDYVKKSFLQNLIEPSLFARLNRPSYSIRKLSPESLVTWNRLDIGMRTLYLELKDKTPKISEKIYFEDLKAQTLSSFVDPDNDLKNNFDVFKTVFQQVYESIRDRGFDGNETLIPVATTGSILNGAHRLSACLVLGKKVTILNTDINPITCDYKYFFERDVPIEIIEMAALKLINHAENIFLAFLWPSGEKNFPASESLFKNIIYKKNISLTPNGAFNLLYECYNHMDWVGSPKNGYKGLKQKMIECFPHSREVQVIAFQASDGIDQVKKIKEQIRKINNIGFSSVHITDNKEECKHLAHLLFNDNGLHFLNYARPGQRQGISKLVQLFNDASQKCFDLENFVIDGSFVLELYGLRKADDTDLLMADRSNGYEILGFPSREQEIAYHELQANEIIFNPAHYFIYHKVKIIGFSQLLKMKKNRAEHKDILDVQMMAAMINDNKWRRIASTIRQKILYAKIKGKFQFWKIVNIVLTKIGLYEVVRIIYRRLRRLPDL
jgi:hypothetical protein